MLWARSPNSPQIKLGIPEFNPYFLPRKLFRTHILLPLSCPTSHHMLLVLIEEVGVAWVIWKAEPDCECTYNTEYSFDNVYPP
jgi:hypothetical protein